jgi:hypothetical protein
MRAHAVYRIAYIGRLRLRCYVPRYLYNTACELKPHDNLSAATMRAHQNTTDNLSAATMRAHQNTTDNLSAATMRARPPGAFNFKLDILSPTYTGSQAISALSSPSNLSSLACFHSFTFTLDCKICNCKRTQVSWRASRPPHKPSTPPPTDQPLPYHLHSLLALICAQHQPSICIETIEEMADIDQIVNMAAAVHLARREPVDRDHEPDAAESDKELDTEQVSAY